jgi:hypothetical protein
LILSFVNKNPDFFRAWDSNRKTIAAGSSGEKPFPAGIRFCGNAAENPYCMQFAGQNKRPLLRNTLGIKLTVFIRR